MTMKLSRESKPHADNEERLPLSVCIPVVTAMGLASWLAIFAVMKWIF
jgi:hypothetical protein